MRSRGFWIHSSQRFSLDPVLEVAVELASEVAVVAKVETAPKGPVSSNQFVLAQLILGSFYRELHLSSTTRDLHLCVNSRLVGIYLVLVFQNRSDSMCC